MTASSYARCGCGCGEVIRVAISATLGFTLALTLVRAPPGPSSPRPWERGVPSWEQDKRHAYAPTDAAQSINIMQGAAAAAMRQPRQLAQSPSQSSARQDRLGSSPPSVIGATTAPASRMVAGTNLAAMDRVAREYERAQQVGHPSEPQAKHEPSAAEPTLDSMCAAAVARGGRNMG